MPLDRRKRNKKYGGGKEPWELLKGGEVEEEHHENEGMEAYSPKSAKDVFSH